MAAEAGRVQISFPQHAAALLDSLNRLRLEGKFCDVAVHVGGRVFPAHKSVLAAASPFFHDKLLLQDGGRLLLPAAIDPDAFEGLLHLIYSGRLTLLLEALPGHLLVASGLQMWHVVDQCSAVLRELEGGGCRWGGRGDAVPCVDAVLCAPRGGDGAAAAAGGHGGGDGAVLSSSSGGRGAAAGAVPSGGRGGADGAALAALSGCGGADRAGLPPAGARGAADRTVLPSGGRGGADAVPLPSWAARGDGTALPPSSWPQGGADGAFVRAGGEEEVLKVCVEEDDDDDDDDEERRRGAGALRAVLEEDEEEDEEGGDAALPPAGAPAVLYIKQESSEPGSAAGGGFADAFGGGLSAAEVSYAVPQPAWKPVDLHGNEILAQAAHGRALHAPVKICAAPDGKRFGCLCGKRFAVKPKRDRHIMLTFSLRPFACSACHKRFKLKHHLTEHMKTHDGAARACERCGRSFRLRSGLAKHRGQCQGKRWAAACWACE